MGVFLSGWLGCFSGTVFSFLEVTSIGFCLL